MLDIIHLLATVSIGLFAGALLTEACILVPYWRRMDPADFFTLHGGMGFNLFRYFAPVTVIAVVFSLLSAGAALFARQIDIYRLSAALLCLSALAIFFVYFKNANAKFASHSLSDAELPAELKRWAGWHWVRTVMVIGAFVASIRAAY